MSSLFTVPELVIGVGLSEAASSAFEPKVEVPKQAAWVANPQRVPDLGLIAALVAGGKVTMADGQNMANRLGFSNGTMESLVWLAQNRLSFPELLRMWRLSAVNSAFDEATLSALFDKTIAHEQLDWDYRPYLRALKDAEIVGLGDVAIGVVRGALPAPPYVPVPPPTSGTSVPRFPQVNIDPEQLAAALGFSPEMLHLMIARSGLSLAPGLAAQATFRKLINDQDFLLAIAEGDLRTEWAQTLLDVSRQVPTAGEFVEAWLRGWIDQPTAEAGAGLHGMTPAHADLIYKIKGRPVSFHEITTGLARGGTYPSVYTDIPDPYRKAIQEADIRPEWASLHYANRYIYPSAFVLRALAQAGDLGDQAAVEQVLLEVGWKPSFAATVSAAWVGGTGGADKHVAKAQTSLWTATHKSYIAEEIDDSVATAALTTAGVAPTAIPAVLTIWKEERALIRKQLSPTEIRKAVSGAVINPATGVAWTHADALAALLARGYDQADAETFLAE